MSINRDTNFRDRVQILYSRDPCEPLIPTTSIPQPATPQHVNVSQG
jgi:hypothetical protein